MAIALVAGGAAGFVTAFAHHIVSTSPVPAVGVVDTTPLADSTIVYADNTRHIEFFLWAPNTCGLAGAAPVWSDSEPVTTATLTNSTVTSATVVPHEVGTYEWTAEVIVTAGGAVENGPTACGDEPVTVNRAGSSITTDQSNAGGAMIGTSLVDTATVTGDHPSGTVTFSIFGPNDATCANSALESWATQLGANGKASVPGPGYATTQVGTYQWVAHYGGDANNASATSACGTEAVTIAKGTPTIATVASDGGHVGIQIHDTSKVSGGDNPTGTVSFFLYAPNNATCSNGDDAPGFVQKVTVPLGADGSASGAGTPFTTTAVGTYHWIATYSGDANNGGATSGCSDEAVVVTENGTTIATTPSAGGATGTKISDVAKVAGGLSATGTVTFNLYAPSDPKCSGTPIYTSATALGANGTARSGMFTATANAGTYNWIATYGGDADTAGVSGRCGQEPVVIVAGGVQGITTGVPGTGSAESLGEIGLGAELVLLGIALGLGAELLRERRRV